MIWDRSEDECQRVLTTFTQWMRDEIDENWVKGDREAWGTYSLAEGLAEIRYHVDKLEDAVDAKDKDRMKEHCADVANCTMIFADLLGLLEPAPLPAKKPEPPRYVHNPHDDFYSS